VDGGAFLVDAKPPGLDIPCSVDRLGTCVIESLDGVNYLYQACLSYARANMAPLRVSSVELLCQAVMGWIPAVEYMMSGVHGLLWPCPILLGNKCYRILRPYCW
jgi:hypothetical protein